jgi:hypothetical protein
MEKLIKASVAIGVLLVGISVSYYFIFTLPTIQKQRLAVQVAGARLEQDQKCSKGAKAFFEDSSWSEKDSGAWYENHFNSKLNRCFILIHSTTSTVKGVPLNATSIYKLLVDVNDGRSVAEFQIQVPFGVGRYDGKLLSCDMLDKYCKTEEEFDAFVKSYMEP